MRETSPAADGVFLALVADHSPVALAQAVQHRTRCALRLLGRRSLLLALEAPEELGESVRLQAEEEVAFRFFVRSSRRFDDGPARRFFERTFEKDDPVHEAIATFPPPPDDPKGTAAHEGAYLAALAALAGSRSRAAHAATRAVAALSFGHTQTVAPLVTSFRPLLGRGLLPGLVLRPALDLRVASLDPKDVIFRRDPSIGRTFRRVAARAQELAADVTGDRRYFRLSLLDAPAHFPLDGPSAGLSIFAATVLASTHRNPPPPWIGFSGAFDESGLLAATGNPRAKVCAAAEGGIRALFMPESARQALADRRPPIEIVFLPALSRDRLFERIEKEIAALAPSYLRLREADVRRIYARGESLFLEGRKEAETEFAFLVRALEGRGETNALATLGPAALARLGRCQSRRGDVTATAASFDEAERRLESLVAEKRLEREGREILAELGVWKAINLIDFRDFEGALAAVEESLRRKQADLYTTNHSLARSYGTRGIVRYSYARTIEDPLERARLFEAAERDLATNMELVQPYDRGRVRGYQATLELYRGRAEKAAASFRAVLQEEKGSEGPRAPNPRWSLEGLAHALYDLGRAGGGLQALEEAVAVSYEPVEIGIDQEIPGRLCRWRGAALRELGRYADARQALDEATFRLGAWPEGHPKNALAVAAWIDRAILEAAAGEGAAAIAAARTARRLCESFSAQSLRRHFAPTAAAIDRWLELLPAARSDSAVLYSALGRLLP